MVSAGVDTSALPYPPTHRRVMLVHLDRLEHRKRSCALLATISVDGPLKILRGASSGNKSNLGASSQHGRADYSSLVLRPTFECALLTKHKQQGTRGFSVVCADVARTDTSEARQQVSVEEEETLTLLTSWIQAPEP